MVQITHEESMQLYLAFDKFIPPYLGIRVVHHLLDAT